MSASEERTVAQAASDAGDTSGRSMGGREFILLAAALMGLHALGMDAMLPALPQIGMAMSIGEPNALQWVLAAYLFGFGASQLLFGPLSDTLGRRPILLGGLAAYGILSLLAGIVSSFPLFLALRAIQGGASAAIRVVAMSVIRDRHTGPHLARVMSLAMMAFLAAPIMAPAVGQLMMLVGTWRWIFGMLVLCASALLLWVFSRLEETLPPGQRRPFSLAGMLAGSRFILTHRTSLSLTIAGTLNMGVLMGYVISSQQLFEDFGVSTYFPLLFASGAVAMVCASLAYSFIVFRYGSEKVATAAVLAIVVLAAVHLAWLLDGTNCGLLSFLGLNIPTMFCVGFLGPNYLALAMQPMGKMAGLASSVQGVIQTLGSALLGTLIGQLYHGGPDVLVAAFLACALLQLAILAMLHFRSGRA